ncbi:peptidylprolyl isomerase [Agriterribacter sp.]|uniref:peptidylprolyl isomerase n=1 Tax=Agriterribacter sp. TaxID=2821509 RepID=UPI002C9214A9|nr:peptidylprolyl isomerase [Agriterribacter sp.]HTN07323.1 peptidylprolyl isomerase [Agriterribacter sp.]
MKNRYSRLGEICFVCYWIAAIIVGGGITGCTTQKKYDNPVVVIETKFGNITVELYPKKAPATVSAFLRNMDSGYFNNSSFYRVLRKDNQVTGSLHSYLIQGGVWQSNPELKSKFNPVPHESTQQTGILHKKGTISMARNEPGTATSEFFICVEDEPGFDYGGKNNADGLGYAAFGEVVEGMETVMKIYRQPEDKQRFMPPVTILNIHRMQQEIPGNISHLPKKNNDTAHF